MAQDMRLLESHQSGGGDGVKPLMITQQGSFNLILLCSKVLRKTLALGTGGMMGQGSLLSELKANPPRCFSCCAIMGFFSSLR